MLHKSVSLAPLPAPPLLSLLLRNSSWAPTTTPTVLPSAPFSFFWVYSTLSGFILQQPSTKIQARPMGDKGFCSVTAAAATPLLTLSPRQAARGAGKKTPSFLRAHFVKCTRNMRGARTEHGFTTWEEETEERGEGGYVRRSEGRYFQVREDGGRGFDSRSCVKCVLLPPTHTWIGRPCVHVCPFFLFPSLPRGGDRQF